MGYCHYPYRSPNGEYRSPWYRLVVLLFSSLLTSNCCLQSDGWFYIYIIAQPPYWNCNHFRQCARLFSCFFCSVAAHCTEENIVHLVDFLLSDRIGNIVRICHLDLDTLVRNKLNRLLSLFYGRCVIQFTLSFPTARSISLPAVYWELQYSILPL